MQLLNAIANDTDPADRLAKVVRSQQESFHADSPRSRRVWALACCRCPRLLAGRASDGSPLSSLARPANGAGEIVRLGSSVAVSTSSEFGFRFTVKSRPSGFFWGETEVALRRSFVEIGAFDIVSRPNEKPADKRCQRVG